MPASTLNNIIADSALRANLAERFWLKVDRRGPNECWAWLPSLGTADYGSVTIDSNLTTSPHRVAFALTNGVIPDGRLIRHNCDNPPCCNPSHLLIGTHLDNARDRVERGRQAIPRPKRLDPLNVRFTDAMRAELQALADEQNRSISNLIVTILEAFLDARREANQHQSR